MNKVRTQMIDGKRISIYDSLLSKRELHALEDAFKKAPFVKQEIAKPETANTPHWVLNLNSKEYQSTPLSERTALALTDYTEEATNYRPYRHYCNFASYGDLLFSHRDSAESNSEITALWYITSNWDIEWGGETLFFNENQDAEAVVSPKPGRLVLFDSNLLHTARIPTRLCTQPRFSFAIKLEKFNNAT